ncbi:MAG TPA: POTRA domain-containing protein, partial [Sphingobacteriaceae bacterium]
MKAYIITTKSLFASILLLLVILSGCRSTRYLKDYQSLVTKVTLDSIDKRFKEQAYLYVQSDIRPNSKLNLALYNYFNTKKGEYRTDRIKNIGEEPNILDSALVEISRKEIEKFLASKGFLKAKVKSEIEIKNKRAHITFTASQGPEFHIRNFSYEIND